MSAEERALCLVKEELERAISTHPPFNSAHEGYAVILEELEELWKEVMRRASDRSNHLMMEEAIQVAAMGVRFVIDVCLREK